MADREPFSMSRCVHFCQSGLPCKKGVEHAQVVDGDGRVPCVIIRGVTGKIACDLRVMPEDPPPPPQGSALKMLGLVLDGKCPKCGEPKNGEMEFNGAVLALPCRHVIRSAREG